MNGRKLAFAAALCILMICAGEIRSAGAASLSLSSLNGLKKAGAEQEFSNEGWSELYTDEDLKYLACVIYCETEPLGCDARVALGNIVINRMNDTGDWAHVNTIKEVIYDTKWGRQFDCTSGKNSMMDRAFPLYDAAAAGEQGSFKDWQLRGMRECTETAKDVMCGKKTVPDSFVFCRGGRFVESDREACMQSGRRFLIIESHIYFEN